MRSRFVLGAFVALTTLSHAQEATKVVLGRYAQVMYSTGIHSSPDVHSRTYYHAAANQYLVVRPLNDKWCTIMMERGLWGYGLRDAIEIMPFEVIRDAPRSQENATASRSRTQMVRNSLRYIGTPYVWGGNDVNNGIDCSGFVKQLYGTLGLNLPRTAAEQALVGQKIERLEDLKIGDRLYFWDRRRGKIGHTGMYAGGGLFVHSSSGHKGVATDDLRHGNWLKILVAARR